MASSKLAFTCVGIWLLLLLAPASGKPKPPPPHPYILDLRHSPQAKLQSVTLDEVRLTEGFWAERLRQTADVTLPELWRLLADPKAGHVLENMRIAAGLADGSFVGVNWQDEWLYKWIEAAACVYRLTGDRAIDQRMGEGIELIRRAQQPDGYISTQITVPKKPRFQRAQDHEVYNMGHLLTAAVVHHRMTGKDSLLGIARRTGDFLCNTLGVSVEPYLAHNPSAVMGLVELYRETGEKKYLDCAKLIVDRRGSKPKRAPFLLEGDINGTDLIQDRTPLRKSTEVVGHNVFFTYLFAGAGDVYLETGDQSLQTALRRLWDDLTEKKMCLNGGVSPMGVGSSHGYPVHEAVGPPYFLPSATCYNETCGQIGNLMWNYRMLCADENAAYADVIEQEIYNGILPGIGLDGKSWFYRNVLRRYEKQYKPEGSTDMAQRSQPSHAQICCPSNMVRMLAEWPSYLYSVGDETVWIHQYAGSELTHQFAGGQTLAVRQETQYPWEGHIHIAIDKAPSGPVVLKLRIPGWCAATVVKLNGQPVRGDARPASYFALRRTWKPGDTVDLELDMPVRLVEAHPKAEQLRNQVAVMRGPVLYCLESPDLPEGLDLNGVYLPSDIELTARAGEGMPFGVRVLEGQGLYRNPSDWTGQLYRPLGNTFMKLLPIRLIPYFAWANRGLSTMSVWLPVVWR